MQLKGRDNATKGIKRRAGSVNEVQLEISAGQSGGVFFDFRSTSDSVSLNTSIEGGFRVDGGNLTAGLKVVIRRIEFPSLEFLSQMGCDVGGLRVPRALKDDSACLEWTSPK